MLDFKKLINQTFNLNNFLLYFEEKNKQIPIISDHELNYLIHLYQNGNEKEIFVSLNPNGIYINFNKLIKLFSSLKFIKIRFYFITIN